MLEFLFLCEKIKIFKIPPYLENIQKNGSRIKPLGQDIHGEAILSCNTSDLFSALIEEMYEWLKDDLVPPTPHLVRFMAHLVLFFRTIGLSTKVMFWTILYLTCLRFVFKFDTPYLLSNVGTFGPTDYPFANGFHTYVSDAIFIS